MAQIDISARILGDKQLAQALANLSATEIPAALRAGVRVAARGARTTLAKEITARYSLKSARIKQDITNPSFRDGGLTAVIRTGRRPITMKQFGARMVKSGLSVAILRNQRFVAQRAFLRVGGSNNELLPFRRIGKPRVPLEVLHGPSIHGIYTGGKHAQEMQRATEERISEQLVNGTLQRLRAMGRGYGRA